MRMTSEEGQVTEMRFKLLSATDLSNVPPMQWMVRGVIPSKGLAAIYGPSGTGKSFLVLDMGCAIAAGDKYWFGRRIVQSQVVYVCLEGESGMSKRVKAWSSYYERQLPDGLRFIMQPFNIMNDDVAALAKALVASGMSGSLVIIDTLNRAAPGADENSSVDMGKIIAAANRLQNMINGVVLLVHHTGKDATKGLRGHSSLYAALDAAIEVVNAHSVSEWGVAKSKDDGKGHAYPFKLEIVSLGLDKEREKVTSCVAVSSDTVPMIQKKKINLGSNQKIALDVLSESFHVSPDECVGPVLPGKRYLKYDEAVLLVSSRIPTDARHKKSRAIDAIAALVQKQYLFVRDEWLWSTET